MGCSARAHARTRPHPSGSFEGTGPALGPAACGEGQARAQAYPVHAHGVAPCFSNGMPGREQFSAYQGVQQRPSQVGCRGWPAVGSSPRALTFRGLPTPRRCSRSNFNSQTTIRATLASPRRRPPGPGLIAQGCVLACAWPTVVGPRANPATHLYPPVLWRSARTAAVWRAGGLLPHDRLQLSAGLGAPGTRHPPHSGGGRGAEQHGLLWHRQLVPPVQGEKRGGSVLQRAPKVPQALLRKLPAQPLR